MKADPDFGKKEYQQKLERMAQQVLGLARDDLLLDMRFFASALSRLKLSAQAGRSLPATDGERYYYDPKEILKLYRSNDKLPERGLLHSLLHLLFAHPFHYDDMDTELWDIAADAAVESVIGSLGLPGTEAEDEEELKLRMKALTEAAGGRGAAVIYRYLKKAGLSEEARCSYIRLLRRDDHGLWRKKRELAISQKQWEQLARKMRMELKAFSAETALAEALSEGLSEALKKPADHRKVLERFLMSGEQIELSPDEYDLVFYTYGLKLYGNLPLIEPLESREEPRIRELVIALDTSASVRGELLKQFLNRLFMLLKNRECFFSHINVHILQCDNRVLSDTVIHSPGEAEDAIRNMELSGFGGTDFRPAFDYIREAERDGRFRELKGLIYLTDGYGIYPERKPPWEVLFVFPNEDENRPAVPAWAASSILN